MVFFLQAPDEFGVVVGGGIGFFLAGEANEEATIVGGDGAELVMAGAAVDFNFGPFGPEVDAGGGGDEVGDVRAADAGGGFEEVDFAVLAALNVFSVGDAAEEAHGGEDELIFIDEAALEGGVALDEAGGEDAALVADVHGGAAVAAGDGEEDIAFANDGVDVEDVAGDVLLEEVVGLVIAEGVDDLPAFVLGVDFADADGAGHEPGFEDPGRRNLVEEGMDEVVIEDVDEGGDVEAFIGGLAAHGELVAEVAGGGFAHAGDAEVFAEGGGGFEVEVIEGDDAVDDFSAGEEADGVEGLLAVPLFFVVGHVEDFVDGLGGPFGGVFDAVGGKEEDAAAEAFGLAEKFVAFFVAGDAENGERTHKGTGPQRERAGRSS